MDEPQLILVRHGATAWSESGQHTSHTDIGLTDAGRAEARRLHERLAPWRPQAVWTSPLRRARETAIESGHADAEIIDDLREWDYGDYEGLTTPEIQYTSPGWSVFEYGGAGARGESPEQLTHRVDRLLGRVRRTAERPLLMFAHAHLLRALTARWLNEPVQFGARLHLDAGGICLLGQEHELQAILAWNLGACRT